MEPALRVWELPAQGSPPASVGLLPYFCRGEVVKGFDIGSEELGIPTEGLISAIRADTEGSKIQIYQNILKKTTSFICQKGKQ